MDKALATGTTPNSNMSNNSSCAGRRSRGDDPEAKAHKECAPAESPKPGQGHHAPPSSQPIIVGVDTHKHVHVAVAIDLLGARLATCSATADRAGYAELVTWARTLGTIEAFGIEGTGSYGVGLASFIRRHAIRVVEVSHCDRRKRRNIGKSDTIDAETAARSVLSGIATAIPKTADGAAEMVRQIKIARDTAVKARSAAIIALKRCHG